MQTEWKPIEALPVDSGTLSDGEFAPLLAFWQNLRRNLAGGALLTQFEAEVRREWSIETGQIEGIYDLNRGVTETLILRGLDAELIPRMAGQMPPEQIAAMLNDHLETLEGLFQFVKGERRLSKSYINELHASLLRSQDTIAVVDQDRRLFEKGLIKGAYKTLPNNPTRSGLTHYYAPPVWVESEMDRLLALHAENEANGVAVEIRAAWLHHRFTQIHPYQDGNGRVARALASLVVLQAGGFPVVVLRDGRTRYLDALEAADSGDLRPLTLFFVEGQRRLILRAAELTSRVATSETVEDVLKRVEEVLTRGEREPEPAVWTKTSELAGRLVGTYWQRMQEIAERLTRSAGKTLPDSIFEAQRKAGGSAWLRLAVHHARPSFIRFGIVPIGSKTHGLVGIDCRFEQPSETKPIMPTFQVNYLEAQEDVERRFKPWMEAALTTGLSMWNEQL